MHSFTHSAYSAKCIIKSRRKATPRRWLLTGLLAVTLTPTLPGTFSPLKITPAHAATRTEDYEKIEAAEKSRLFPLTLPAGAMRAKDEADIAKFAGALRKMAKAGKCTTGEVEVLVWMNNKEVKTALSRALKTIGYGYAAESPVKAEGDTLTVFVCAAPRGKSPLLGLWVDHGSSVLLAWTSVSAAKNGIDANAEKQAVFADKKAASDTKAAAEDTASDSPTPSPATAEKSAETADVPPRKSCRKSPLAIRPRLTFQVDASTLCLNVMGRKMPAMPDMPKVTAKPGFVRGYVRDIQGHPLKGALIGVRSTAVGGFYSGASAKTDAQGYYEIKAPWGVGSFYCAGYTTDYGELIAAFGLHPTDGETDEFATASGVVKNWVLLPYGVGDRAKAQDDPKYCGNYYGGTLVFNYYVEDGSQSKSALPANSQVEITLTPDGPLLDGSKGTSIVVRKAIGSGFSGMFYLNNIPVGVYKIKAQVQGIGALRLRETGPYANRAFGMAPKEVVGEAHLLLKVYDADPNQATARHGHWNTCQISLERP